MRRAGPWMLCLLSCLALTGLAGGCAEDLAPREILSIVRNPDWLIVNGDLAVLDLERARVTSLMPSMRAALKAVGEEAPPRWVSVSPESRYVLALMENDAIWLCDVEARQCRRLPPPPGGPVDLQDAAWRPQSNSFACAQRLKRWNPASPESRGQAHILMWLPEEKRWSRLTEAGVPYGLWPFSRGAWQNRSELLFSDEGCVKRLDVTSGREEDLVAGYSPFAVGPSAFACLPVYPGESGMPIRGSWIYMLVEGGRTRKLLDDRAYSMGYLFGISPDGRFLIGSCYGMKTAWPVADVVVYMSVIYDLQTHQFHRLFSQWSEPAAGWARGGPMWVSGAKRLRKALSEPSTWRRDGG